MSWLELGVFHSQDNLGRRHRPLGRTHSVVLAGCSVGCDASDDDDQPWMAASIDWPWSQMLKPLPGMVQWSVSSLLFAISMIYDCHTLGSHHTLGSLRHLHDCMHPCHITHSSPMLKQWPGMVKWSVSSLFFAISVIYDCMHPCHITHWALFAISMIYDCMHTCHITHWALFAISMIYDCMHT